MTKKGLRNFNMIWRKKSLVMSVLALTYKTQRIIFLKIKPRRITILMPILVAWRTRSNLIQSQVSLIESAIR